MNEVLTLSGLKIAGISACVPKNAVENLSDCHPLFGDDIRRIVEATGIKRRTIASQGVSSLDLSVRAAEDLISSLAIDRSSIGAVVNVTFTPAHSLPPNATVAQNRLGLSKGTLAFDIDLGCSGYCYGLYVAGLIASNLNKSVLLLDGDVQSSIVSRFDKATAPILSDAGSATLVTIDAKATAWKFAFLTEGGAADALIVPAGGSAKPIEESDLAYQEFPDGSKRREKDLRMDGFAVFNFVATDVARFLEDFMKDAMERPEIFVPHQPNAYMVRQLGSRLGFTPNEVLSSCEEFGNPGSVSVPLTLVHNSEKVHGAAKRALLAGFGAGLSASAALVDLSPECHYSLIKGDEQ